MCLLSVVSVIGTEIFFLTWCDIIYDINVFYYLFKYVSAFNIRNFYCTFCCMLSLESGLPGATSWSLSAAWRQNLSASVEIKKKSFAQIPPQIYGFNPNPTSNLAIMLDLKSIVIKGAQLIDTWSLKWNQQLISNMIEKQAI